jgi:hypothetical protein
MGVVTLPDNLEMSSCESLKTNQTTWNWFQHYLKCDMYGHIIIRGGHAVAPKRKPISTNLVYDLVSTR